jgi:hypothetical protein
MEELRLAATQVEGCFCCLGTATRGRGKAMASVNFDQGVVGGEGLRGEEEEGVEEEQHEFRPREV